MINSKKYIVQFSKQDNHSGQLTDHYLYYYIPASWEYEGNHGPGLVEGWRFTTNINCAEEFDSIKTAKAILSEYLDDRYPHSEEYLIVEVKTSYKTVKKYLSSKLTKWKNT